MHRFSKPPGMQAGRGMLGRGGGANFIGFLDDYPTPAQALSMRRLLGSYKGPLIRLREDSGDTERDFYPKSNGDLDTNAISDWITDTGASNLYVVTTYDQSGNGKDASQATELDQLLFRITNASMNNRPSFETVSDSGDESLDMSAVSEGMRMCVVRSHRDHPSVHYYGQFFYTTSATYWFIWYTNVGVVTDQRGYYGVGCSGWKWELVNPRSTTRTIIWDWDGVDVKVYINNSLEVDEACSVGSVNVTKILGLGNYANLYNCPHQMAETVSWPMGDKPTAAQREAFVTNQQAYY